MSVPCDGLLVSGTGVTCDESAMTGESDELKKDTPEGCMIRKAEFEADSKEDDRGHHSVPTPLLLSGT